MKTRPFKPTGCESRPICYLKGVNGLTVPEKKVLILVLSLLAIGGLVKVYRAAHPPATVSQPAKS